MKVLVLCSYRKYAMHTENVAPFIYEQVKELENSGCEFTYILVKGGGIKAYIKALIELYRSIKNIKPQIIHAHGGLCAFLANFQRKVPVVSTFHGSDINNNRTKTFSKIAMYFSSYSIFVSQKLIDIACPKKDFTLIPCGVDVNIFYPLDKIACRNKLGWDDNKVYVLFSKAFHVKVKNYPLAKAALDLIPNAELIELKAYTREEVNVLMNACDIALMTSFSEGSPQFVKEAMACNCPIVSTDVGDVREVIKNTSNCFICTYEVADVVEKINKILENKKRTNGSESLKDLSLDNATIASKILFVYNSIVKC